MGLLRLGRGTHLFGFAGHRFDGKCVLDGSALVKGVAATPPPGESGARQGPRGFYFERPGRLKPEPGVSVVERTEGDKGTPIVPTGYPEDPIGTVVMITANCGVMVKFPMAAACSNRDQPYRLRTDQRRTAARCAPRPGPGR
ncbi:hypothetical protein GCM10009837_42630 [Streptomyces durmitorensis]